LALGAGGEVSDHKCVHHAFVQRVCGQLGGQAALVGLEPGSGVDTRPAPSGERETRRTASGMIGWKPYGTQTRISVHRVAMAVATPMDDRSGHWTRRTDRPSPQSVARPFARNLQGVGQ